MYQFDDLLQSTFRHGVDTGLIRFDMQNPGVEFTASEIMPGYLGIELSRYDDGDEANRRVFVEIEASSGLLMDSYDLTVWARVEQSDNQLFLHLRTALPLSQKEMRWFEQNVWRAAIWALTPLEEARRPIRVKPPRLSWQDRLKRKFQRGDAEGRTIFYRPDGDWPP